MEKVTMTIEGTAKDVMASLQILAGMGQQQRTNVSWLPNEIEGFFDCLQPDAQHILREIATSPEAYNRDTLINTLGITARGLAGRLSSIGHNMRRFYPMKPKPIELNQDTGTETYTMLPEFAGWIRANRASD